jgi:hypothetical protein
MMAGQHRRNVEDPAVAIGTLAQGMVTTAGLALSVWLLLSNYQAANHGLYFLYTVIAAGGPILAFFLGRKLKGWISAYETAPRAEESFGFFGERIQSEVYEEHAISALRS